MSTGLQTLKASTKNVSDAVIKNLNLATWLILLKNSWFFNNNKNCI